MAQKKNQPSKAAASRGAAPKPPVSAKSAQASAKPPSPSARKSAAAPATSHSVKTKSTIKVSMTSKTNGAKSVAASKSSAVAKAKAPVAKAAPAKPQAGKVAKPAVAKPTAAAAAPARKPAAPAVKAAAPKPAGVPMPKAHVVAPPAAAAQPARAPAARAMPAAAKPASPTLTAAVAQKVAPLKAAARPAAAPAQAASAPAAAAQSSQAAAAAAKKPVSSRHGFKTSEFIVYPAHGVGRIVGIEEQEIAGISLELFVIQFEKDKMTLRVPTSKLQSVGMRKLAEEDTVRRAMETLKGKARIKRTMWSRRAQEYEAKINSGDLVAIAEVVRDLYRSEAQPEQSYSERQLYEAALDRMTREIAAVDKLDERGAMQRIVDVLSKSAKGRRLAEEQSEAAEVKAA